MLIWIRKFLSSANQKETNPCGNIQANLKAVKSTVSVSTVPELGFLFQTVITTSMMIILTLATGFANNPMKKTNNICKM